jgi:hypothetical protein
MRNFLGLFALILLLVAAYFLYQKEKGNDLLNTSDNFKDFAIQDTAAIDQIFISQPNGKKVLISRREGKKWMVNGKFEARPDAIKLVLKTAHDLKVQAAVSKKTFEGVVRRLASGSTKVEFYENGESEPLKVWYVGDATASRMGTYMLLEKEEKKSSMPYIGHLLMERGFLGPRFMVEAELWRNPLILQLNPKEIKSIAVEHSADSMTSFRLIQEGNAKFMIKNLEARTETSVNADLAIPYLKLFSKVFYEYVDEKTPQEELDSIYNSPFRHKLEVVMQNGDKHLIKTFNMPVAPGANIKGVPIDYHPERMYAYSSFMGEDNYPIVQNFYFDKFLPDFYAFTESTNVEK